MRLLVARDGRIMDVLTPFLVDADCGLRAVIFECMCRSLQIGNLRTHTRLIQSAIIAVTSESMCRSKQLENLHTHD